jgi:hypothetical protein
MDIKNDNIMIDNFMRMGRFNEMIVGRGLAL